MSPALVSSRTFSFETYCQLMSVCFCGVRRYGFQTVPFLAELFVITEVETFACLSVHTSAFSETLDDTFK